MAISRESRKLIESGDFAGLEDEWLRKLTEDDSDLAYFTGVARALSGNGEEDRARELLDLLDEHLRSEGEWELRLALLEQAGHILMPENGLHEAILTTLRELHPASPSRDGLMELVGLHRAVDDLPKTWQKVARFRVLMTFEIGAVVWMKDKGAGRVVDVNLELGKLKVDFDQHPSLSVGLAAAGKLLQTLPETHFLHRKLDEPDEIRRLAEEDPPKLLQLILESREEPMNASDIRGWLAGTVPENLWSSWWSGAKTHPQLVATGKGARQTYRLAATSADASDQILKAFRSRDRDTRIEVFRREAKRDPMLKQQMAQELENDGKSLASSDPAAAIAVWSALEKGGVKPDDLSWSPSKLVEASSDPAAWIGASDDRAVRTLALDLVRASRSDWLDVLSRCLARESDPRLLSYLTEAIESADPTRLGTFLDDVFAKPRKHAAAFVWLLETRAAHPNVENRNPLRLLHQVLDATGQSEFSGVRTRLKNLIEQGDTLASLISRLKSTQAERAEDLLKRAHLEDYLRDRLLTALHLQFPSLRPDDSDALYATKESISARRLELKNLLEEEIPANRRAIEEARALGDLRENFEYKSARQRHEYLSARVSALDGDLRRVKPIDLDRLETTKVRIGVTLQLSGTDGTARTLTILGPWESAPEKGIISYQSETAQKVLGKEPRESIELDGQDWVIEAIETTAC